MALQLHLFLRLCKCFIKGFGRRSKSFNLTRDMSVLQLLKKNQFQFNVVSLLVIWWQKETSLGGEGTLLGIQGSVIASSLTPNWGRCVLLLIKSGGR